MELKKLTKNDLEKFFSLYEEDFPYLERRSREDFLSVLEESSHSANFIFDGKTLVGYICFWEFKNFIFIEHIATLNSLRGHGYGSKFLNEFIANAGKKIVLEVEPPENEIAIKRIKFYERVGFNLISHTYFQPSYHGDGGEVEMKIMTTANNYSKENFENDTALIRKYIYKK